MFLLILLFFMCYTIDEKIIYVGKQNFTLEPKNGSSIKNIDFRFLMNIHYIHQATLYSSARSFLDAV